MDCSSGQGHSPGLGNCGHLRHCVPMLHATHLGYLEWPMLQPGASACNLPPRPYSLMHVQLAWRYFVAASNIATDLLIIAQIMVLIINIQTSISRRLTFFGIFAPRIL